MRLDRFRARHGNRYMRGFSGVRRSQPLIEPILAADGVRHRSPVRVPYADSPANAARQVRRVTSSRFSGFIRPAHRQRQTFRRLRKLSHSAASLCCREFVDFPASLAFARSATGEAAIFQFSRSAYSRRRNSIQINSIVSAAANRGVFANDQQTRSAYIPYSVGWRGAARSGAHFAPDEAGGAFFRSRRSAPAGCDSCARTTILPKTREYLICGRPVPGPAAAPGLLDQRLSSSSLLFLSSLGLPRVRRFHRGDPAGAVSRSAQAI